MPAEAWVCDSGYRDFYQWICRFLMENILFDSFSSNLKALHKVPRRLREGKDKSLLSEVSTVEREIVPSWDERAGGVAQW